MRMSIKNYFSSKSVNFSNHRILYVHSLDAYDEKRRHHESGAESKRDEMRKRDEW